MRIRAGLPLGLLLRLPNQARERRELAGKRSVMAQLDRLESEENLAAILIDESPDAVIALGLDGRVLFWSAGAERLFGYSRDESRGRSLEDLIVPAERRAEARQALDDVLHYGSALFESVRRKKDGSLLDVDVSMRLVKDEQGGARFIAANKKDITLLKRAREERELE